MKQSFTLQPAGRTVDSFIIQSPSLNSLYSFSCIYLLQHCKDHAILGIAFVPEVEVEWLILSQSHVLESFFHSFPQLPLRFPDIYGGPAFSTYNGIYHISDVTGDVLNWAVSDLAGNITYLITA